MLSDNDKPKIIVDDDWKAQAQAEKEQLAKEQAQKQADSEAADAAADEQGGQQKIPPASFFALVNSIAMQTMLALGGVEDPKTKKRYVDLELAKFHIDTLSVLQEKTQGNLSEEETKLLDRALYDLRMGYVQISQHAAAQKSSKKTKK